MHAYYFFVPVPFSVVLVPMNEQIEIFRLQEKDLEQFMKFVSLFSEVFDEDHSICSEARQKNLLAKPDFYAVVATQGGNVIGGLTAYELERYYNDNSELYIYDMAMKIPFQNQGVGKKLISYLKDCGLKNGIETIFVEAHSEDVGAVKFYESTFGESEKVDHFNLYVKSGPSAIK